MVSPYTKAAVEEGLVSKREVVHLEDDPSTPKPVDIETVWVIQDRSEMLHRQGKLAYEGMEACIT